MQQSGASLISLCEHFTIETEINKWGVLTNDIQWDTSITRHTRNLKMKSNYRRFTLVSFISSFITDTWHC